VATTAAELNTLATRLDDIADRVVQEYKVEIPQEKIAANGDETLLANLALRKTDLKTASTMHADAKTAFMAAKATYKVEPTTAEKNYAAALVLAADIEAILDYRAKKTADGDDSAQPADPSTGKDDKDGGDPPAAPAPALVPAPVTRTDSPVEEAEETDENKGDDKEEKGNEPDPILAAIAALGKDCREGTDELRKEIGGVNTRLDELAKGTLPEELAQILSGLDPEVARILASTTPDQLNAALGGRGLTDKEAAFLKGLMEMQDAGPLDRFRYTFWGTVTTGGAHS
jgi:hypothetical protein